MYLALATPEEIESTLQQWLRRSIKFFSPFFKEIGVILVDFKLEFGRDPDGQVLLS